MSATPRLRDARLTTLERQVLESAKRDVPSAAHRDQLMTALGLGTVLSASAVAQAGAAAGAATHSGTLGSAAGCAAPGAAVGSGVAAGAKLGAVVVTKWAAIGLVAGGMTGGAWMVGRSVVADSGLAAHGSRGTGSSPVHVSDAVRRARPVEPPGDVDAPDAVRRALRLDTGPGRGTPVVATLPSAADGEPPDLRRERKSIAEELALVDEARKALASGALGRVLRLTDERQHRFAEGTFAPEADLLRCDALLALGRPEEAAAGAERFLAGRPSSPHADRMRRLLARANASAPSGPERPTPVEPRPAAPAGPGPGSSARFPNE